MQLDEVLRQAQDLGFFGPSPLARQRAHSEAFVGLVLERCGKAVPESFLDLGSGGGLPGLVLAAAMPESRGTLLEVQQRRAAFLAQVVERLGWAERIAVVNSRAESAAREPGHRSRYALVVARSFAAPAVTAECAVGFLRPGGQLVVSEPPDPDPGRWPEASLAVLGLEPPTITARDGATVAALALRAPVSDQWPRKPGIPSKRPLW